MKWLDDCRMRLVLAGFVAAIVLCCGQMAVADFVIGDAVWMDEAINHPSSTGINSGCSLSHDGLRFYFDMRRDGGRGSFDIWVCERESSEAPWGEAVNLGSNINGPDQQDTPTISPDELELYFWTHEGGQWRYMQSTRTSKNEPWGPPTESTGINPGDFSSDGLTMYFGGRHLLTGYGEGDIWMVTRGTLDEDWGDPVNLGPNVNNERRQGSPSISHDDLALFFNEDDSLLMRMSVRRTRDGDWGPAIDISASLCPEHRKRYDPEISPDGRVLYFHHHDSGAFTERKFWQASINPIVDFNGDDIVDILDLSAMIEHWGTDHSFYDIGPMPWGDGVVDAADLEVFMRHWGQEPYDPTLIAHWKLDETDGTTAYNSAIGSDGSLNGDPAWEPAGGYVDGALRCDGLDDCVGTPFVLDPADQSFSVFAWIKGGAPGQVIISQIDGVNWLLADAAEGNLMTSLSKPAGGRTAPGPLVSESSVVDGTWHRVGLVWDGSTRALYIDDVLVAEDSQPSIAGSTGGLYIGCDKDMTPGSFFSGLIDDVRIYNRAVRP